MIKINKNLSFQSLVITNLLVMFLAIFQSWNIFDLIIVYWFQSVIIGIFNFFRILGLENYSVKGFTENGVQPPANKATKIRMAIFFTFHYGIFHFVYLGFIMSFMFSGSLLFNGQFSYIFLGIVLFFINHLISYRQNIAELKSGLNIGAVMFRPYTRIMPMHLFIIFFGFLLSSKNFTYSQNMFALIIFLLLKTGADIMMHLIEHRKKNISKNDI